MSYLGSGPIGKTVRLVSNFTANSTANTTFYPNGGYTKGYVDVYVEGVKMVEGTDYTATDGLSIVFGTGVVSGQVVEAVAYGPLNLYNHVRKAGDAMTGDLTVPNVYIVANTSANSAIYNQLAVNSNLAVNSAMTVTGNVNHSGQYNMTGNIVLTGSLVITGEATSISTQSLAVEDTIINLGTGNITDTLDIGFAGKYGNGSSNVYAGIVRDATSKDFFVFQEYALLPNNDINTLDGSFQLATLKANFSGNVSSENILVTQLNAGNVNLTSGLTLTGDATGIRQLSTAIWGGDPSSGQGRLEYHSNGWYIAAGPNSDEIANFQRGSLVKATIDNDGIYQGTANNANNLGGQSASFYTNATNISTGTLDVARLATSGVVANTYGNSTFYTAITVDNKGRVTSAQNFVGATAGDKGQKGERVSSAVYTDSNNTVVFTNSDTSIFVINGVKGQTGATGTTGVTGTTGAKGDKGDTGSTGAVGSKGDKGDTGTSGAKGDTGITGDKGDKGDTGAKGDTGSKGDKGDTGTTGSTGDKGQKGDNGEKGQKGELVSSATYSDGNNTVVFTNSDTTTFAITGVKGNKGEAAIAGSNTHIIFNDSGTANGVAGFTFDKTATTVRVGNTTVNSVISATTFAVANSTSNTRITIPTTGEWSNGSYFLNANGSWSLVVSQPFGANTELQFNDSGAFGSNNLLKFDKNIPRLSVGNNTVNSQINATSIRATSHIDGNGNALVIRDSSNAVIWGA